MEKRVLFAFVLSLAVFIGWGYFLAVLKGPQPEQGPVASKSRPSAPAPGQPVSPGAAQAPSTPAAPGQLIPAPAPTTPPAPQFPGTEVLIKVTTDKMTYVISTRGAVLREALLKKYRDDAGNPINLVHSDGTIWPLALASDDDSANLILQNAYFETSAHSLVLNEANPTGTLTLTLNDSSGLHVVRAFTFNYDSYFIDAQTRIEASPWAAKNLQYKVVWGPGLGGQVESKTDYFAFSGPTTFVNDERVETPPAEITDKVRFRGDLQWTAIQNKYFAAALVPQNGIKSAVVTKERDQGLVGLEFESVQSSASVSHLVYVGTKELGILEDAGHKLVRVMDYGWMGNKFAFLVKPLLKILNYFYGIFNNYGWSIILVTVCIKILFFPLTHKSFKSMKGMQKIQPYVKVIQERNKNDRQKMNEEMLELYKKHKVNPLGGCLPMLLQIPVFIALYHALFFSIELRGAPFIFWIHDLSVQDPYYVTPVMMGATMFLQQKMTPKMGDPMQQKIMMFLPILFTFLFISFPSGLVIYWTVNNLLTIAQQFYIYKIAK